MNAVERKSETPTPRTSAARQVCSCEGHYDWEVADIDFARDLERELAAANEQIGRLKKAEDKWVLSSFMLPADQTWCWVSDGKSVWHGKRDVNSAGGWTNEDTWEDFASAVTHWQAIARPEPPQE